MVRTASVPTGAFGMFGREIYGEAHIYDGEETPAHLLRKKRAEKKRRQQQQIENHVPVAKPAVKLTLGKSIIK